MSKQLIVAAALAGLVLSSASPSFAYRRGSGGYGGYGYGYMMNPWVAAGQYQLYSAQAATSYQQAYSLWLDNKKKHAQTYFDLRRMNASYRAEVEMEHPHATSDQIVAFSKARDPQRLTADQFDPATAVLNWPPTLKNPEFAEQRNRLDNLFAERLGDPVAAGLGTHNCHDIQHAAAEMSAALRKKIAEIDADEYITAEKFLKSVAYEARFAPETKLAQAK